MSETYALKQLYDSLRQDSWRKTNPFSEDIKIVNDLIFDSYAEPEQREEHLSNWLQRQQPCLFGSVAAAQHWLHFCILTERDFLTKSDQAIATIVHRELAAWKRRSLRPTEDFSTPAFGFVLLAASHRLAYAAPDKTLQLFALKLQELWGCEETQSPSGTMHWETLYLRNPETLLCRRFRFSVDFFAAQGDKRWWHDHRAPAGLMFTANSVGHMRWYREWYLRMKRQNEWILQTAMLTIDKAWETDYGKATWLRPLGTGGQPVAEQVLCPFSQPERVKDQLKDRDWTKYNGWLHTDHSIRPDFFHEDPKPLSHITSREYLEDFTYLYRPETGDHAQFVAGEEVPCEEILKQLGPIEDWSEVIHWPQREKFPIREGDSVISDPEAALRIRTLLRESRKWRLTSEELRAFWES